MDTRLNRDPLVAMFDGYCCWPKCQRKVGDIDAPLCANHLFIAHRIVRSSVDWVLTAPQPERQKADAPGFVYFVRFSDRIKIGFTRNLVQRLQAVPHDELLHVEPGSLENEKQCHALFAHLRETGEWFRAEPDLLEFIDDLRQRAA